MDIKNKIKPATLEEAFEIEPLKSNSIIDISYNSPTNDLQLLSVESLSDKKSIRDIFLDDNENFEDAEIFYPSKMNIPEQPKSESSTVDNKPGSLNVVQASFMANPVVTASVEVVKESESNPFIIANTEEVSLKHLQNDCIIPVFRDSEQTIAHFQLINSVQECIAKAFPYHSSDKPEIRVSHKVSGRIPEALHKPVKELLDNEKTLFWERMAFIIRIPSIKDTINGNELSLTIGGIRNYKSSNLFNKKSMEHFKVFCGFQVKVCSNLCVWSDGFVDDLRASSVQELQTKILQLLQNYNAEQHLSEMKELTDYSLTESQFASLIGRSRLYQHLPKAEKQNIPLLDFKDSHINMMAKDFYEDKNFCRQEDGNINLWDVYNLFTQANKSSYIDTFLDRNLNAFEFSKGIQKALNGNSHYHWFLS